MKSNNIPLSVLMENAKSKLIQSFNEVVKESKLPAFLIEGILLDILSEVRNRKNIELISDINVMQKDNNRKEE